ncbi:MAG: isoprenyl transferase [Ruminiclostridium sp.]
MTDKSLLPVHVGIIMDGNGRWAQKRGLPRKAGHAQGAKTFKRCVDDCRDLGIKCVTFYAFSTENWKRPKDEVDALMKLFGDYLDDIRKMSQKNTKLLFLGDMTVFSEELQRKIKETEEISANNTGMILCIAVNYGGRDEIVHAVRRIADDAVNGIVSPKNISEKLVEDYLYTKGLPEVDLIIRPSGEMRTSNFLIWQAAYAEFISMDVLWPDFKKSDLEKALEEYAHRNRRFGGI